MLIAPAADPAMGAAFSQADAWPGTFIFQGIPRRVMTGRRAMGFREKGLS